MPKAASLAETLQRELGETAELVKGGGGEFVVTVDGEELFSKKKMGRYPEHEEVVAALRAR